MGQVHLHGTLAVSEERRPADQRDVVEVHNVKRTIGEDPTQAPPIDERPPRLLREQGAQQRCGTAQGHHLDTERVGTLGIWRGTLVQHRVGVGIVNHSHLVTAFGQRPSEALHPDAVAAEIERWIEGREETEARAHDAAASRNASSTVDAVRSQVN